MNTDFLCERLLREKNKTYHELVRNTTFVMHNILEKYTNYFPEYTDHSSSHALQVLDFCNRLIAEQAVELNEDELYVLIMSCYLHDTGMGISLDDYARSFDRIVTSEYKEKNPQASIKDTIRDFHQEFSGFFIRKYAPLFEIPSDEHIEAIARVSRGHRKADLYDEAAYDSAYKMPNGNTVCLPYLASLIRLADELDIARDRNVGANYSEHTDNAEWNKHFAIAHMEMTESSFVLDIDSENADEAVMATIEKAAAKLQETLDVCRDVTNKRTKFKISQTKVVLKQL